ncbi:MAG: PEP-utilizing enzyme [Patescibacteria group bacterium]
MTNWKKIIGTGKGWEYFIARNLPVWHNEVCFMHEYRGFADFGLPMFEHVKVCRGFHTDFYARTASLSALSSSIDRHFRQLEYFRSLWQRYHLYARRLLKASHRLKSDPKDLRVFFKLYGVSTAILDLTQIAGRVVTEWVVQDLPNISQRLQAVEYYSKSRWLPPIQRLERELEKISQNHVNVLKEAQHLHRLFCWIPVNFVSEPWGINYFAKRIRTYAPRPRCMQRPLLRLSVEAKRHLSMLGEVSALNEFRKEIFTRTNFQIRPLFDRIAKSAGLQSWRELSLLTSQEITEAAAGSVMPLQKMVRERKEPFLHFGEQGKPSTIISGREALRAEKALRQAVRFKNVIKGLSVQPGAATGRVKIILEPKDFRKFQKGDILVAKMTSVDSVPIMRHAAAFITDEGGLSCHAAVIAREFGKPCIVGTQVATRVFKDGDRVEVDATRGIVKKIG